LSTGGYCIPIYLNNNPVFTIENSTWTNILSNFASLFRYLEENVSASYLFKPTTIPYRRWHTSRMKLPDLPS
jgi:hypothetical protein